MLMYKMHICVTLISLQMILQHEWSMRSVSFDLFLLNYANIKFRMENDPFILLFKVGQKISFIVNNLQLTNHRGQWKCRK